MSRDPSRKLPFSVWDFIPAVFTVGAMFIAGVLIGLKFWQGVAILGPACAALIISDNRGASYQQRAWVLRLALVQLLRDHWASDPYNRDDTFGYIPADVLAEARREVASDG